jgi:transcriptional regulator
MYTPRHFQNNDTESQKDFIRQNGFGILVNQSEDRLMATHLPLYLSEGGDKLFGHIARGNKQGKGFQNNTEVLAIFSGPHTYISSSWYDHENVPTWNYIAVHAYGTLSVIEGDALYNSLKLLVDKYEKYSEHPSTIEALSPGYVKKEMLGIIGFQIDITRMEATYKLSQNRDDKNHQAVITQLEKRNDEQSKQVADAMRKNRSSH